jgi:aspartate 1-decarboxylase
LLIIAPSEVADATDEPKLVRNVAEVISNGFGDFYVNGRVNPIAAEWKAAQDAGNRRTYLSALKGSTPKEIFTNLQNLLFDVLADFSVDHVVLKGVYSDVEVDGLTAADYVDTIFEGYLTSAPGVIMKSFAVTGATPVGNVNVTVGTNDTLTLTVGGTDKVVTLAPANYDGVTNKVEDLVAALNTELAKITGDTLLKAVLETDGKVSILGSGDFTVKSGTALSVFGLTAGMVAVKKAHVAGQITTGSFAKLLGAYAEDQTLQHNATLAYMGVTPPVDLTMRGIKNHTNALLTKNNDFSAYVSVIASEVGITLPVTGATYWTNGATHYAALVSQLRPESAPTNKIVKGVKGIRFGFSVRQLNSLNQKKFVTFTLDEGNMRVVEGKTTAPEIQYGDQVIASNYTQLSTLRITQTAIEVVRQAAKPFIGEPNQMPQYNALNAAIKGALEGMRSAGALQDYQFSVTAVSAKLDSAKITLSIVPMFELRRISVDVSLRPPTNVTL